MTTTIHDQPITFRVHEVDPRTAAWRQVPLHENVRNVLGDNIESCSDYHTSVCSKMEYHPLLAAVYQAYSLHYPLVLSPDAVWLTISQGVAHHMAKHGERLRERFVAHRGKLELRFECEGWVAGTPENPWIEAFESWASQIRQHVGADLYDALLCDFSTTTSIARAASHVTMMDIFEKYFRYTLVAICGIPAITLKGNVDDWQQMERKVEKLSVFDMSWWLDELRPIVSHFVRASQGDVDLDHWQNICKLKEAYGGHLINGWIAKLFPYLRESYNGPCTVKNPIFETGEGFLTLFAPSGLSQVPFVWRDSLSGLERRMEAIGGLVGVIQDENSLALEPVPGWAVREASDLDVLLEQVKRDHEVTFHPPAELDLTQENDEDEDEDSEWDPLPADLSRFYFEFEKARFFVGENQRETSMSCRNEIESVEWGEDTDDLGSRGPDDRSWHRFAVVGDGRFLIVNLDQNIHLCKDMDEFEDLQRREAFSPICICSDETRSVPDKNPVVALSFTEFLTRLLHESADGCLYWDAPGFEPHADAERFTRRESTF